MASAPSVDDFLGELERGSLRDLATGAGRQQIAAAVRAYCDAMRAFLAQLHHEGGLGQWVNTAHSDLLDRFIRRLFRLAESSYFAEGGAFGPRLGVVAVGGYARREMSIGSDVDLLFLYPDQVDPYVASVSERMQMWLWDGGLSVGCATRTVADTLALARDDVTVRTAILDCRFLVGDVEVFHELRDAIQADLLSDAEGFIRERRGALLERHQKYGESLYLLQPNVKEGAGALRDYHTAYWCTRAAYPALRGLEDLLHFGLLTEREMDEFHSALEFLWRVRNELHLRSKRKNDQMDFEHQEKIAAALGYDDGDDEHLPVERFMGDYYRHARAIESYSDLVIEQCHARVAKRSEPPRRIPVEEGFELVDDHLEIPHPVHLRERPLRLLLAFEVAQRHDAELSRAARRMVRQNLELVDEPLRRDPEAAASLLRILDSELRVMRTLMAMNEVGLLGAFLPEWRHIVCRWQHVMYHTYTVDVHSIFLVEQLRRLWRGKYERGLPELTALMRDRDVDRPVLFLGCLLHDIGKGYGGDHSNKGAVLAEACLERLQIEPERALRAIFLVKQHLLMSFVAQRRDLSDPRVIVDFARVVGDRENLRNLYLLTFADIRASSSSAWNEWKGQLLRELFERTSEFLETGDDDLARAMELIEARVERRQDGARAELRGLGVAESKIEAFFDIMPRRYFISHTPPQIARHALVVLQFRGERLVTSSVREMRAGFTEFLLCTRDVHGLFSKVAGTLTSAGLNILGANVYTTRNGEALEVYRVSTPAGGPDEKRLVWDRVERSLERVLSGEVEVEALIRQRPRPIGATASPSRQPPSVTVSNADSDFYTIADVAANDRIGLLYDLTRAIADLGHEIYISKATTVLDQVADTFYLKDRDGKKITDPAQLAALEQALRRAVEGGEPSHD